MRVTAVERVVLFVDAQNVLRSAHRTFCESWEPREAGQVNPMAVGELLCERTPAGTERRLAQVRIYTGRPESSKQPESYAAHMRQCAAWERAGAVVVPRTLRYPFNWPEERATEKGVDVQLAIDFVLGAFEDQYDVGIIFSTDTDLKPAVEAVASRFGGKPRAETAAWHGLGANRELRIDRAGWRTWCHRLTKHDWESVRDTTNYLYET